MYRELAFNERDQEWWSNQKCAHLYYSLPWLKTLKSAFRFEAKILVDSDDQLKTVFCPVNDVKGSRIIMLPFSDYTPACGMNIQTYNEILDYLKEQYPKSTIILKTTLGENEEIKAEKSSEASHYKIALDHSNEHLISESFQKEVRHAKEKKLEVRLNNNWSALTEFYTLYHRTQFDRFKSIPQPLSFFKNIWKNFIAQNKGYLIEVLKDNKVVSSLIALAHKQTLYYKFSCVNPKEIEQARYYLLFDKLITLSKEEGFEFLDLGLCLQDENHNSYRNWYERLGAEAYPVTYWTYTPEGIDPKTEEKVMKNLDKLTSAMIDSNLNPEQTSAFSEKIYTLYA